MANRLAGESSPYLQQHADNPVDWHPWCAQALASAREQDRPILLSIGYSACHWCHVMAHESFEDERIAALMNERFVCIKVDREERPDLDRLYQIAHQVIAHRPGGWPLTLALDPHTQAPFFAGTYFPPTPRMGMPDFSSVLTQVANWYAQHRNELSDQGERMRQVFDQLQASPNGAVALDGKPLQEAARQLRDAFDTINGGFGSAPKFPQAQSLELLSALARQTSDHGLQTLVTDSLSAMAEGGIHDHVGGGFCRYTVDECWQIPHFEKMLYDNAALLALLARVGREHKQPQLTDAAQDTVDWLLSEMQAPQGGFYASLDADSDGGEGGFYVWERDTVRSLLGDDYPLFARRFGLDQPPNFEGRWHLAAQVGLPQLAEEFATGVSDIRVRLRQSGAKLYQARACRPHPRRDDKILTAWNALTIRGLACAARFLPAQRERCLAASAAALDCIRRHLWRDGRLLTVYAGGEAHLHGYLDDYALLADALVERLQSQWCSEDLSLATGLAEAMLAHFQDNRDGGFFFTADDHEALLYRLKPFSDDSTPAGNGVAGRVLLRLGALLGEPRYLQAAEATLRCAWPALSRQPAAHASLLLALGEWLEPPAVVVLRGDPDALPAWQEELNRVPDALVFAVSREAPDLPPGLALKAAPDTGVRAYICRGMTCSEPLEDIHTVVGRLQSA